MNTKDPNSRIVTIFRANSFLDDAQKSSALEFVSMSKRSLGSYWETSHSKAIGSGLNFSEQKLLMPHVVDCEVSDREFRKRCSEYFAEIKTTVPYDKGIELEIGLSDNTKALGEVLENGEVNLPINIYDFVRYRHAVAHPEVAASLKDAAGNQLKQFYLFDPQAQIADNKVASDVNDKALALYLKVKDEPQKINMLLTLLKIDPREFSGPNAETLKIEALKAKAQKNASDFVSIYEDKFFDELYVIQSLINTNVLKKIGETIIDPDLGTTIGHNTQEAVAWLKDKSNSESVVILKAKMQEGLAKALPTTKRRPTGKLV
jgi:hypothetical protein